MVVDQHFESATSDNGKHDHGSALGIPKNKDFVLLLKREKQQLQSTEEFCKESFIFKRSYEK